MDKTPPMIQNATGVTSPRDDASHLLTLLPEEVWRMILASVDNASDYFKMCAASPTFWDWFSGQRVHLFFEPVMKVLLEKDKDTYPPNFDSPEEADNLDSDEDDDPFHYLAPLRQVCRSWRDTVDRLIQEPNSVYRGVKQENYSYFIPKLCRVTEYHQFESHFLSTHLISGANPFSARAVEIHVRVGIEVDPLEPLYNACLNMLRQYGHHIHNIRLTRDNHVTFVSSDQLHFYRKLKEILLLLPALKVLHFNLGPCQLTEAHVSELVSSYQGSATPILPPTLHSLVCQSKFPIQLLKQLLRQSPTTLTYVGIHEVTLNVFSLMFDGQLSLPLTKVRVWLTGPPVTLDEVLATLEPRCGETLTDLEVELPGSWTYVVTPRSGFSKLRRLHLSMQTFSGVVLKLQRFPRALRNLEALEVQVQVQQHAPPTMQQEVVAKQVSQNYRKQLADSTIWKRFPRLLSITVTITLDGGRGNIFKRYKRPRAQWKAKAIKRK